MSVDALRATHVYLSKYSPRSLGRLSDESRAKLPPPGIHPLAPTHPENGRKEWRWMAFPEPRPLYLRGPHRPELPVLILGGFTSVPGAIIGGLVIGAGEKISEVFLGPALGGGIEIWFAYVVALLFLLVRPQGLFGERIIERV